MALDEQTSLDVKEQPLRDVLKYLGDRHEIYFVLDQATLRKAGVAIDSPVTRSFSGITLRSALKLLLNDRDLTYVVGNGVIEVTPTQAVYPWLRFKTLLWVAAVVAVFVAASEFARKRGRRATAAPPTTRPGRWNSPLPRQFFLKAMLWLMAVVGAFLTGMWWPAIAPGWGMPSYQDFGDGWGKFRWWTGRVELVKWIPDAPPR